MIRVRVAPPSVREEFAGVKWTGNVHPVDAATGKAVLKAYGGVPRVGGRKSSQDTGPRKLPRIDKQEIEGLSSRVIEICCLLAEGHHVHEVARMVGVRDEAPGHVLRVLSQTRAVSRRHLEELHDKSPEGVRRALRDRTVLLGIRRASR